MMQFDFDSARVNQDGELRFSVVDNQAGEARL